SRPSSSGSGCGVGSGRPASGSSGSIPRAESPSAAMASAACQGASSLPHTQRASPCTWPQRARTWRGHGSRTRTRSSPSMVAPAGEAQVVVVAAAEEGAGERAEDPPGAGLLADQAAEVAVEHEGAVGRPEPAGGLEREDVGGNDVRVHGPGSRAGRHDEANN